MARRPNESALAALRRRLAALPPHLRPKPTMLSVADAARFLGATRPTVVKLIAAGKIASMMIDGERMIPVSELTRVRPRKKRRR